MNENIVKRLAALISVKSLVTLALTAVFAYLAITGQTSQEFMTVYTVVIAFYFGTQTQKISDAIERKED
jgi:ABC-type transporter Mla subunit MlaD